MLEATKVATTVAAKSTSPRTSDFTGVTVPRDLVRA